MAAFAFVNDEGRNGPFFSIVRAVRSIDQPINAGKCMLEVSGAADDGNGNGGSNDSDLSGRRYVHIAYAFQKADEDHVACRIYADNEAKATTQNVEDHAMMG